MEQGATALLGKVKSSILNTSDYPWNILVPLLFIVLFIVYVSLAISYKTNYGKYRTTTESINQLLTVRRLSIGNIIDPLAPNTNSVCSAIINKNSPYVAPQITDANISLLQWRPLTVRLAGYLGGETDALNGVFDMVKGTQVAISLGARSFVFDIDYLDTKPCEPLVIYRDSGGVMRSLNTGSIRDGMDALNKMAFKSNYDPVIIVVYLRRIPPGKIQADKYFKAIAAELDPLSTYHLGLTEQGKFHSCASESSLFYNSITSYQKKFIVLCNYDTTLLPQTQNPKDNLNFWVNARLFLHELSSSSSLGSVTNKITSGGVAYAKIGDFSDFLTIPGSTTTATADFVQGTMVTYTIALSPVNYYITTNNLDILLNTLGIHSIPIDVIYYAETPEHLDTKNDMKPSSQLDITDLTIPSNFDDPLSFWTYAGWSRFNSSQ
jgi:hypothetical protein